LFGGGGSENSVCKDSVVRRGYNFLLAEGGGVEYLVCKESVTCWGCNILLAGVLKIQFLKKQ
jgi:hypothetical protein